MKIIFAKNLGFCMGVRRALKMAEISLKSSKKPVQFLGEIVHNEKIVEMIKKMGGKIISNPYEAKTGTLVIRAHGIAPFSHSKEVLIIDATCPLVKAAQNAAKTLLKEKYKIIIIGEKKHPETEGINGNIGNKAIIIENEAEAKILGKIKRIGVLAQTTQNIDTVNGVLNILKEKSDELKWINTLCPQVSLRQKELSEILKKVDGVLVIGSKTSANTQRLVKTALKKNKNVILINSAKELKDSFFKNISVLGVISGTSAPDWEIKKIIDRLKKFR